MAIKDMTFSNGIIKSLEKDLLTPSALMRIIDEPDYKTAVSALKEQGFGKGAETAEGDEEKLFVSETLALDDFARKFSPGGEYSEFCLSTIDFYNAESFLRSEYIKNYGYAPVRKGLIDDIPSFLSTAKIKGKNVNEELVSAYEEGKKLFGSGKATGAEISSIFLNARYKRLLKKCGGDLKKYLKHEIDCKNISTAFRAKTEEDVGRLFLDGGNLKKEDILFIFSADGEKIEKKFAFTPYSGLLGVAIKEKSASLPLIGFETKADGFALDELKKKKYETEGATPFLLYYLYKSAEIANVRVILGGKRAKCSAEEIKRRIKTGYDG